MGVPQVPDDVAAVLDELAGVLRAGAGVIGLYAAGSLALGDYRPGVSDLDLVAVLAGPLTDRQQNLLGAQHRRLMAEHRSAAELHCCYLPAGEVDDLAARHPTWALGRFVRRPLNAVARAELLTSGVVVVGPPPDRLLPPVGADDVAAASRTELATIWRPATRRPWLWWEDVWVDLGLTTMVRAEAAIREGTLLTKSAAIERLGPLGVPPRLVDEIAARRRGAAVVVSARWRARRALFVRRLVSNGIDRVLTRTGPGDGARSASP